MSRFKLFMENSEEEAFWNAVFAARNDDAPKLVFADWLEERGNESLALILRYITSDVKFDKNQIASVMDDVVRQGQLNQPPFNHGVQRIVFSLNTSTNITYGFIFDNGYAVESPLYKNAPPSRPERWFKVTNYRHEVGDEYGEEDDEGNAVFLFNLVKEASVPFPVKHRFWLYLIVEEAKIHLRVNKRIL